MSALFGSRPAAPAASPFGAGANSQQKLEEAAFEIDAVSDMFSRIVRVCHSKCIPDKFHEGSLNKGEGVCIDRCVAKYFSVNDLVSLRMQEQQQQAAAGAAAPAASSSGSSWFGL